MSEWENIYDPNDFISGPIEGIIVGGSEARHAAGVKDHALHAASLDEAHLITHYLRDRVTGAAVMSALCESTPKIDAPRACEDR